MSNGRDEHQWIYRTRGKPRFIVMFEIDVKMDRMRRRVFDLVKVWGNGFISPSNLNRIPNFVGFIL